eukprot:Clim_evm2s16 gene=Clim_evmTU2s16
MSKRSHDSGGGGGSHYPNKRNKGGHGQSGGGSIPQAPTEPPPPLASVRCEVDLQKAFAVYERNLVDRYDRHERLVKISRDITVRGKRAIFALQRTAYPKSNGGLQGMKQMMASGSDAPEQKETTDHLLKTWQEHNKEALDSIDADLRAIDPLLSAIAKEIYGIADDAQSQAVAAQADYHLHARAFSPGIQEYLEALLFRGCLVHGRLLSLDEVNAKDRGLGGCSTVTAAEDQQQPARCLQFTPTDYVLGCADVTGELMRYSLAQMTHGAFEAAVWCLHLLRSLTTSLAIFQKKHISGIDRKHGEMHRSLAKVETAIYRLVVRGSEVPEDRLAEVLVAPAGGGDGSGGGKDDD